MKLGDILVIQEKSKIKAGEGMENGIYPFFTCSNDIVKTYKTAQYKGPALIFGTGGKASVHFCETEFSTSTDCLTYYPISSEINLDLVNQYLQTNLYLLENGFKGAGLKHISRDYIANIEIDLPDIRLQNCIVQKLNKTKKIVNNYKEVLSRYDLLIKSRFIEMFGDPVTNPMGWEVKKLGDTGTCKNGMNFHYDENGVELNCLGVGDFKDYSIIKECEKLPLVSLNELPSDEYLLKNEDLVFVRSNGNKDLVGRCVAVYPNDLKTTFSGFCIRFRQSNNTFITEYLLRTLKTETMRKRMAGRGANIQNLNQQILTNLDVPVPPIELQQQFASFVQQIDKSKFVVQKSLEKAETLYKSLMQEYFG